MYNSKYLKSISVLSILSLTFIGAIYFLYRDIEVKNGKILSLNSELNLLNTRQDYLKNTQNFIEKSKSDLEKIDGSIIEKGKDVEFIEYIEAMARGEGLDVQIESLGVVGDNEKDKNKINYLRLNARVKVSGGWSGVYRFSNVIESMPFKIKLNSATINGTSGVISAEEKKATNVWTGIFDITVLENK